MNSAYRLVKEHRLDPSKVLVLETRPRVGGRTFSPQVKDVHGRMVRRDKGAEFTAPTASRLMAYQDHFNLQRSEVMFSGKTYFEDSTGKLYDSIRQIPLPMPVASRLDYISGVFSFQRLLMSINLHEMWKTEDAEKWDKLTLSAFAAKHFKLRPAREFFILSLEIMYGSAGDNISMLQMAHFTKSCYGLMGLKWSGKWHLNGGSQQISENLVLDGGFKVSLNTRVTHVVQDAHGVTITARHFPEKNVYSYRKDGTAGLEEAPRGDASIQYADHTVVDSSAQHAGARIQTYRARYMILAVPVPHTKHIHFHPPLEHGRQQLVARSAMVTYDKIHISCKQKTWEFFGGFSTKGPFPCFVDASRPPSDGMDVNMIVGFFLPPSSVEVKKLTFEERRHHAFNQIRRELKISDPKLFGTPEEHGNCVYGEQNWDADPDAPGVTVEFLPGTLFHYGPHLNKPIGDRVFVSGSETSPVWNGYMEGALAAGERTANEVFVAMQCEKSAGARGLSLAHCKLWDDYVKARLATDALNPKKIAENAASYEGELQRQATEDEQTLGPHAPLLSNAH